MLHTERTLLQPDGHELFAVPRKASRSSEEYIELKSWGYADHDALEPGNIVEREIVERGRQGGREQGT